MTTPTIPARPTTYNGTQMRSRLEARYAAWLDSIEADWTYEPQCFADQDDQYLPDFRVDGVLVIGSPRTVYVEVKPTVALVGGSVNVDRMSRVLWASQPDALFLLEIAEMSWPRLHFPPALDCWPMAAAWQRDTDGRLMLGLPLSRKWTVT